MGPTTFVYTTTDEFGDKTVVTAVFTPTYQPTSPNPTVPAGTVVNYSDFTAGIPQKTNGATPGMRLTSARRTVKNYALAGGVTALGIVLGYNIIF